MWKRVWTCMLAVVLTSATCGWADDSATEGPRGENMPEQGGDRPEGMSDRPEADPEAVIELGEFWLGIECYPAPPPMVEQLGLDEAGGLVVEQVVPESPAEKAGLHRHDIVVRAGDKPISHVRDLIAVINEVEGQELKLGVVRGGKKLEISVTPAKRPRDGRPRVWREPPGEEELNRLWQWFGERGPDDEWRRPFQLHFFHPGTILPPGAELQPPLPGNMAITIHKQGEEPTKITVKRGEDVWELEESELDELPEDIRPHVERMLGRLPVMEGRGFRVIPRRPEDAGRGEEPAELREQPPREADVIEHRLQRQLDEMARRLEEMRRSIDEWRENRESRPSIPDRLRPDRPNKKPRNPNEA